MSRELALKVLVDILQKGAYSNISLNKCLNKNSLKDCDKAFITELVYGILKNKERLDYVISKFSNIKIKKISVWILNILRIGIYQLMFMDKVLAFAAVNESVKLAKKYGHTYSAKFVNGVLRNVAKNIDNINYPDKDKNPVEYLSVWYSYPKWLVSRCLNDFGYDFTKDFLESSNEKPKFCIRVNTLKTTVENLMNMLKNDGIIVTKSKVSEYGLIIENPNKIVNSELYKKGYFTIQDESSMLVASVLEPREDDIVVDVCAAPGGKTGHIAEIMKNKGCIYARDLYQHKIKLVEAMTKRLGISNIKTKVFDATNIDNDLLLKADKVLVDAPCTGLGIMRRKPDIKWNKENYDIIDIVNVQYIILENAAKYLKVGGTLVYSTCTISREENIDVVNKFLSNHHNFKMERIDKILPKSLKSDTKEQGYIEFYPNVHKTDGFFIAKMKKIDKD